MLDGKRDKQIIHTASKHDNIVTQLGSAKGTHMYIYHWEMKREHRAKAHTECDIMCLTVSKKTLKCQ